MAEETAVAEAPETSQVEESAPVEELETADTEAIVEETGEGDAETGVSEEEIQRRIDEALAAERSKAQEEQNRQNWQRQVQWANQQLQQRAEASLDEFTDWLANEIESKGTRPKINKQVIQSLAANLAGAVATEQWNNIGDHFRTTVAQKYPGWKPSLDMQRQYEAVNALPPNDPSKAQRMYALRWDWMEAAIRDSVVPTEAEKLAKDIAAKNQKASAVAQQKQKDAEKASADRPTTNVAGTGVRASSPIRTKADSRNALYRGEISSFEHRQNLARLPD